MKKKLVNVRFKDETLSPRQIEVLGLIGHGLSNSEMSIMLNLSYKTVENHIGRTRKILSKGIGRRINDRTLVLLAKEMLDGYKDFSKLFPEQTNEFEFSAINIANKEKIA